jgi:hypothetical protein
MLQNIVIKRYWDCIKNKHVNQWSRIESSEISPHICSQLIFDKDSKNSQWIGIASSIKEKNGSPHKKIKLNSCHTQKSVQNGLMLGFLVCFGFVVYFCFCFILIQGFKLSASWLLRQTHYSLSKAASPLCSGILEIGSCFLPRLAWTTILGILASFIAWNNRCAHHIYLLVETAYHKLYTLKHRGGCM